MLSFSLAFKRVHRYATACMNNRSIFRDPSYDIRCYPTKLRDCRYLHPINIIDVGALRNWFFQATSC